MSGTVEVVMQAGMLPAFREWLNSRGHQLVRTEFLDSDEPDALATYSVTPQRWLMDRMESQ